MKDRRSTEGSRGCKALLVRVLFLAALILAPAASAFARMEEEPRSFSLAGETKRLEQVQLKTLPRVDTELLLAQDQKRRKELQRPEPLRFAVAADVTFTLKNSGTWQKVDDGRLWRLRIHSPGAVSHNLGITRYDMPRGAKLWIYDPGHEHVEGPYMARHRSQHGSLWTPVIAGEEIVVEVFVPTGVRKPNLEIRKANQGYRSFDRRDKMIPGQGTAGSCENDVICPVGAPWADQIRAVGAYTLNGTATCTGTLLNNTAQDGTPYFLSAYHCNVTAANASTVVVYWNYESPVCGAQGPGSTADNQSGAILRARYAPTDFLLLELSSVPPASYNVYYSGWDASGAAPPSTVAIHHPQVDVKSISFSNSTPPSSVWGGSTSVSGNHWRPSWDSGVTEPGSSGSCLFSTATKRCIGQLHGGASYCGAPSTSLWDDYGKLSVSWNGGGTAATRLKDWLDPLNSGVTGMDGDPHVTTVDGIRYDFQGAGEYVALRDIDGVEIQTRTTAISTTFNPGPDPYDGLATCVSINTAVAAKVDGHRVTIQPNLSGVPDPSGLQVRVDGVLTTLGSSALPVGAGRILKAPVGNGYEINFPNGTALYVTPRYWSSQGKWYLNVEVFRNAAADGFDGGDGSGGGTSDVGGLMAPLAPGSWLPALPDGSSLGSMPATLHQRYVDLYQKFGGAWRVGAGSLFDYAPGTSTATFTIPSWPPENPPCTIPQAPTAKPLDRGIATELCRIVGDPDLNANCVFDVMVTGEPGFADLFRFTERIRAGATFTTVTDLKDPTGAEDTVTFTATVTPRAARNEGVPAGAVQFLVDGKEAGEPVPLGPDGQAEWKTNLEPGEHQVSARYIAEKGGVFLDSSSFDEPHTVEWK